MAEKLGLPYQAALRCTTASEFLRWQEYFRQEDERKLKQVEKMDFYFAQLTAETRNSWVSDKDRKKTKIKDFLLKLEDATKETKKKKAITREERTRIAKSFWLPQVMQANKKSGRRVGK